MSLKERIARISKRISHTTNQIEERIDLVGGLTKKVEVGEKDFEKVKVVGENDGRQAILRDIHYGILIGRIENTNKNLVDYILHPTVGDPIYLCYHDLRAMELIEGEVNTFGDIRR